jgi:hypothetical protein
VQVAALSFANRQKIKQTKRRNNPLQKDNPSIHVRTEKCDFRVKKEIHPFALPQRFNSVVLDSALC